MINKACGQVVMAEQESQVICSVQYVAHEWAANMRSRTSHSATYSPKIDVWSAAVMCAEAFGGDGGREEAMVAAAAGQIGSLPSDEGVSTEEASYAHSCWWTEALAGAPAAYIGALDGHITDRLEGVPLEQRGGEWAALSCMLHDVVRLGLELEPAGRPSAGKMVAWFKMHEAKGRMPSAAEGAAAAARLLDEYAAWKAAQAVGRDEEEAYWSLALRRMHARGNNQ